jgi:multidrug efflux pump subunit AcrA (membrane-fusion protein)
VTLWSLPDHREAAHVREIAQAADPQSRTYRVKLALDHPGPEVRLGMTASVRLAGTVSSGAAGAQASASDPLVRIPASALFHSGSEPAVWLVPPADHKLVLRVVRVARYGAADVDVSGGLAAGDEVVTQGVHTVTAGERVNPEASARPAQP